uniref:Uncharacterized protein n=1 Tax=Parascaris equorum TaxID=6256 RepID=A0A914S4G2_PAREQ
YVDAVVSYFFKGSPNENLLRKPPLDWPAEGEIEIENLFLRYRENLDYVLKGVSAHIKGGEKIGIVGRTGAGWYSLLFYCVFWSCFVSIDKINKFDCTSLEAHDSSPTFQDPVLFSGTLRMNLDPFEHFTDSVLWTALKMAHLEPFVSSLADKLEHNISEGGENLRYDFCCFALVRTFDSPFSTYSSVYL